MFTNESYIKAFGGDSDAAEEDLKLYNTHWRKGGRIGNLPLGTLLDIAVKHSADKEPEPIGVPERKKAGRPAGSKNKKPEPANV